MSAGEERMAVAGGRVVHTLVFLGMLGCGLLAAIVVGLGFHQRLEPYFWPEAPATILESGVAEEGGALVVKVRYRYAWAGRDYVSTVFRRPNQSASHRDEIEAQIQGLAVGTVTTCRVNPSRPPSARLRLNGLEIGRFFVIPALFLWAGIAGLRRTFFPRKGDPDLMGPVDAMVTRLLFGGVFAVVGWTVLVDVMLPAWKKGRASVDWIETPCRFERMSGAFRPEVAYRYTFGGREFQGDRVDFRGGISMEKAAQQAAIESLEARGNSVCYVNPAQPFEAVLRRGPGATLWVMLAPAVFLAAGIWIAAPRPRRRVSAGKDSAGP